MALAAIKLVRKDISLNLIYDTFRYIFVSASEGTNKVGSFYFTLKGTFVSLLALH